MATDDMPALALEKVESADVMRAELEAGALLKDMFEKYGIL